MPSSQSVKLNDICEWVTAGVNQLPGQVVVYVTNLGSRVGVQAYTRYRPKMLCDLYMRIKSKAQRGRESLSLFPVVWNPMRGRPWLSYKKQRAARRCLHSPKCIGRLHCTALNWHPPKSVSKMHRHMNRTFPAQACFTAWTSAPTGLHLLHLAPGPCPWLHG